MTPPIMCVGFYCAKITVQASRSHKISRGDQGMRPQLFHFSAKIGPYISHES